MSSFPLQWWCREIEGGRLVVHVVRDLRSKQARAEKMEAKTGKYVAPRVHFKELKQLFRNISDTTIRYRLRDKCECMPSKVHSSCLCPFKRCCYSAVLRIREQGVSRFHSSTLQCSFANLLVPFQCIAHCIYVG